MHEDLPSRLAVERRAIGEGTFSLLASAFADVEEPAPLPSRRLERPTGRLGWETTNTARRTGRCLNMSLLVGRETL